MEKLKLNVLSVIMFVRRNLVSIGLIILLSVFIAVVTDDGFLNKEPAKGLEIEVPMIDVNITLEEPKEVDAEKPTLALEATDDHVCEVVDNSVVNVEGWELINTRRIDENRVGYYYRRYSDIKEWYTIFRNESNATN